MNFIDQQDHSSVALIRTGADPGDRYEDTHNFVARAHKQGQKRLRRRRALATVVTGACLTAAVAASLSFSGLRTTAQPPAATATPVTNQGFQMPALLPRSDDGLDLPGDDGYDWRGQISQAVSTYPGRLVMPSSLPPQTEWLQAATHGGLATVDAFGEGPGVIICSGDATACGDALPGWESIHEGRAGTQDFVVLASSTSGTQKSGLDERQREFWNTTGYQTDVPAYLSSPSAS